MGRVRLSLACGEYDRTHALQLGTVQPDGIDLNFIPANPAETFWRQLRFGEFDASEMSMSAYIMLAARNDERFVAIPAFTSRAFRHGCIFVRRDAGIDRPEDLAGRRIGVPQYHMTAALWIRGILLDEYHVRPESMTWIQAGLDTAGYPERLDLDLPSTIDLTSRPDASLSGLLLAGEIDAIIGAECPAPFRQNDPRIARLFPKFVEVERAYHSRTGYFPIMHCIALRRDVYEAQPWIARNLLDALERSKAIAEARLPFPGAAATMLPWQVSAYEETIASMGRHFWSYGIERNRAELETMVRYAGEQGLAVAGNSIQVEALFAPETTDALPSQVVGPMGGSTEAIVSWHDSGDQSVQARSDQ